MIVNTAQTVLYNGAPVQAVLCNGVVAWPSEPVDGFLVSVNNTGASAEYISAGLSAYSGDNVLIFTHEPSTASYTSDRLPSGAKLYVRVLTDIGRKCDLSATGVSLRYTFRSLGDVASAIYTGNIADNVSIDLTNYGDNTFYVSGSSEYSRVVSASLWDVRGEPLTINYVSGDSSVSGLSANRTMSYYYTDDNGRHDSQKTVIYLPQKTYSAVSSYASAYASLTLTTTSTTAYMSAALSDGAFIATASARNGIQKTLYRTLQISNTAETYTPSATSVAGDTTNYLSWNYSAHNNTTQKFTANFVNNWCMSGIAP